MSKTIIVSKAPVRINATREDLDYALTLYERSRDPSDRILELLSVAVVSKSIVVDSN